MVEISDKALPRHLKEIGISRLWARSRGEGVGIALFDSGVDTREGAARRQLRGVETKPWSSGTVVGRDYTRSRHHFPFVDEYGHGTKMAAILCARPSANLLAWTGCLGAAPGAALLNLKIGFGDGSVSAAGVLEAARDLPRLQKKKHLPQVRVALLAFDWELWREPKSRRRRERLALKEALAELIESDVLPVVAAGDSAIGIDLDGEALLWREHADRILVVGASRWHQGEGTGTDRHRHRGSDEVDVAVRKAGYLTETSNYGPGTVHVAALGERIPTLTPMGAGIAFGTSAAAAIVAGSAALLTAADESLIGTRLRSALLASSRQGSRGKDEPPGVEADRILAF